MNKICLIILLITVIGCSNSNDRSQTSDNRTQREIIDDLKLQREKEREEKIKSEILQILNLESPHSYDYQGEPALRAKGSNTSGNFGGETNLSLIHHPEDQNLYSIVNNSTGSPQFGYENWSDVYRMEYNNMFKISEDNSIGIGGIISESQEGTRNVHYNMKFMYEDSTLYISFFNKEANWSQWSRFKFNKPDSVLSHVKNMYESL